MLFNSVEYACLLFGTFAGFWIFAEHRRIRVLILLVASYLFYASFSPKYLGLIFFSSSLDFFIGRSLSRTDHPLQRRLYLALSVCLNLGILCTFKYFNFFASETAALLNALGIDVGPVWLNLVLPAGLSFYTFATLSYVIDVYRRETKPAEDYFEYLLFISFFPKLIAGPIVRADALLPKLALRPAISAYLGSAALFRIGLGLVKKIAIADFLGAHLVDPVLSNPEMYSSIEILAAAYAYAFQIYADFSAYSDIAIGSAALFGLRLPENFDLPYRAVDLREFWQRWHISLSTWLRDYLYIPLGGSRAALPKTMVNLFITMLLGGLWHGAAMTFVLWGAFHGLVLGLTRVIQRWGWLSPNPTGVTRVMRIVLTFHLVCAAWVLFRSPSVEAAADVFGAIGSLNFGVDNLSAPVILVLSLAVVAHFVPQRALDKTRDLFYAAPAPVQAALLVAAILVVQQVAQTEVASFIYGQF